MENIIMKNVFAEMSVLFNYIDLNLIRKIPLNILECIEMEKNPNHKIIIDPSKSLNEQNLLEETIALLTMLKLDYFCENEEEKNEILNILNKNEIEYQNMLREKYNPDDIFKNTSSNINKNSSTKSSFIPIIVETDDEYEENNIFNIIINKIKSFIQKIKSKLDN